MALDDVVSSTTPDKARVAEATARTVRWLDRCLDAHARADTQNLFAIVQGGLHEDLRRECLRAFAERDARIPGYAIGGLSGGESKDRFWRMVSLCARELPKGKPRYLMGVGYAEDLVVCVALGVDMFDCVFPTRTARFGSALVRDYPGALKLPTRAYAADMRPIDDDCGCSTCRNYTRAYLHTIATREAVGGQLISVHNIAFQMRLMKDMRAAIADGAFDAFVVEFMERRYKGVAYPQWITDALDDAGIVLPPRDDVTLDNGA
jgi:tRNA-guanine transglycosylase